MSWVVGSKSGTKTLQTGALPDQKRRKAAISDENDPFRIELGIYQLPPTGDVSPDEFESFAQERLRFLRWLEQEDQRRGKEAVQNLMIQHNPFPLPDRNMWERDSRTARELVRKDVISHFALRLAYRAPEKQKWFIEAEKRLLEYRLKHMSQFLKDNPDCKLNEVDESEVPELVRAYFGKYVYKVPFTEVYDLVKTRQTVLVKGEAYCKLDEQARLKHILRRYSQHLEQQLTLAYDMFGVLPNEFKDQVSDFLDELPLQSLGKEFDASDHEHLNVQLADLDKLSQRDYPLCMKMQHQHIRRENHMPHTGRLQYGLFLKGIGLTVEQSLQFWHDAFVPRVGEDGWKKKNYAYNIRYNYGEVGRRQSWNPYNCHKIIASSIDRSDPHGCPFRKRTPEEIGHQLAEFLSDPKALHEAKKSISRALGDKQYTHACIEYFRAKHGQASGPDLEASSMHPNLYFLRSLTESRKSPQEKDADRDAYAARVDYGSVQQDVSASQAIGVLHNEVDLDETLAEVDPDAFLPSGTSKSSADGNDGDGLATQMQLDDLAPLANDTKSNDEKTKEKEEDAANGEKSGSMDVDEDAAAAWEL